MWSAGSNNDGQLGLGPNFSQKNAEFRLVRALKGDYYRAFLSVSKNNAPLPAVIKHVISLCDCD